MNLEVLSINIRRREKILEAKNSSNKVNIRLLTENVFNNSPNVFIIEQLFKNWKQLDYNNTLAFSKALNVLKEFCNKASESQKKTAINVFKEDVLFAVKDSKKAKEILNNSFNNKELLEYANNLIIIDRIIKNKKSLNKKQNIDILFKEANLTSTDSIENVILEVCDSINQLPIKFGTKYTVAVENIKYCLDSIPHEKFSDQQLLETVTDYFLFNISNERDLNSIRNILENSKLYSDKDKSRFNFLKGIYEYKVDPFALYITEADDDKSDPKAEKKAEDMLDDFKKDVKKEPTVLKSIISKIYVKSPDMIIDELPNIFSVLRNCVLFSTLAISPFLTIIVFIVDKFISMNLKRDKTEKMLTKFKAEKKKMKKKLAGAKTDAQKKKLEAYIKKLDEAISKITDYRDSLYSERENDEKEVEYDDDDDFDTSDIDDDDFDMDFDNFKFESCIDPNIENNYEINIKRIDLKEYYDLYHDNLIRSLVSSRNIILNRLNRLKGKLYEYKYCGEVEVISEDEIKNLSNRSIGIENFIVTNDRIHIPILSLDITSIIDQSCMEDIYYIYDDIINTIEESTSIIFVCIENSGTIYLSLSGIKVDASVTCITNEHVMYRPDLIKMASIMEACDNIINMVECLKDSDENTELACKYIKDMDNSNLKEFNALCKNSICIDDDEINTSLVDLRDYNRSINNLSESTFINTLLNESKYSNSINTLDDLYYQSIVESTVLSSLEILHELSITNTLKMASDKLKNGIEKLTDKEKILSKRVDDSVENFKRKVEMNLTNKNRESVIKSTILPSASTCLKIILGAGAVGWLVSPYIAVVGVLGALAISKAGNIKERQYVLDEINVQLELIDKKKQLAENNNDMKALEALMQMETKLKRERQRIKYKLKDYTVLSIDRQ